MPSLGALERLNTAPPSRDGMEKELAQPEGKQLFSVIKLCFVVQICKENLDQPIEIKTFHHKLII